MLNKKFVFSFAFKFMLLMLAIIVFITVSISVIFLININTISYTLARTNIDKNVENLRDSIESTMLRYTALLNDASYGTSAFFDNSLYSYSNIKVYYESLISTFPEVELLYFTSNELWNSNGGYWISGPLWIPPQNWDQRTRPWFINAKDANGGIAFSEPFVDQNTGGLIISLSKTVRDTHYRDIGVIAMDMLVTKLDTEINRTIFYSGQHLYLLNKDGLYITNSDPDKVMTDNFFTEANLEQYKNDVLFSNTFHKQVNDMDFYSVKIPLTQWYLVSLTPKSVIFEGTNILVARILIICFAVFALCIVISVISIRYMLTNPLKEMQRIASSMSNMNFDNKISKYSSNEIGDTQRALIKIQEDIKDTLAVIGKNANMVTSSLLDLSASSQQISATANQQSASVSEIVTTMENNKELSVESALKTIEVAELAASTERLSLRGSSLRDLNEDMMLDILNQNTKIIEIINNLADMLSRVDESIQLIDSIADRTKLIAFNAALEASSAGEESGARFSVVAGEIRRFADNVVDSVAEIKEKIFELQEASKMLITEANNGTNIINIGYKGMKEQKEIFESIVETAQNVAQRSQQISNLSKQQEMASVQVFTALKEISSGVNQFVNSTEITKNIIDKLNSMSIELEETVAKYQNKTEAHNDR